MDARYFTTPQEFRDWLEEHHAQATELLVGFYKLGAGKSGMTWAQAVDEALCFGWIDSVRRSVDAERYTNRFTPRKRRSTWSAVNIRRVEELQAQGRMQPAGLAAFAARDPANSAVYSHEQLLPTLDAEAEARFQADPTAWAYWEAQPAGYRRAAIWWVVSAKRAETRERRLNALIASSAGGERLPQFARQPKRDA